MSGSDDLEMQNCVGCTTYRACKELKDKWYCVTKCYKKFERIYR